MSTKNIYLFKVSIRDTQTNTEVPVQLFRGLLREIFDREGRNNALKLTYEDTEPMMLDILENTEEYLFARLNRKRPTTVCKRETIIRMKPQMYCLQTKLEITVLNGLHTVF